LPLKELIQIYLIVIFPLGLSRQCLRELLLASRLLSNKIAANISIFEDAAPTWRSTMRNETIAIHVGYDPDPTTKSVAVPIYQTAAYARACVAAPGHHRALRRQRQA
jgi:hypothetical protein